jgi:hypothetical protein
LSRFAFVLALAVVLGGAASPRAEGPPGLENAPEEAVRARGTWTDDYDMFPQGAAEPGPPTTLNDFAVAPGFGFEPAEKHGEYLPVLGWLGLRHSQTHGRHVGRGGPLVGSSWLNRPVYLGGELGAIWLTRPIYDEVTTDVDAFGGIFAGWDRDPYWGAELRFDWATPELINREARDTDRTDSLYVWSYSILYYPWGDATWRPYWRAGIGDTHYDFPLEDGTRHDQWMLTFPVGFGVKYPIQRWLAARAELTDYLGVGHHRLNAQNNVTLTFGLEWRFGAHPRSYWPWQPSRHIW